MWINQLLWCPWCQSYQRAKAGECTALCMLCQHSEFSLASVKPGESQMLRTSRFLLLPNGWSAGKEIRQFQQRFHDCVFYLLRTSEHRCDWQVSPVSIHHSWDWWELLGIWANYRFFPHGPDPPSSPSLDGCWKQTSWTAIFILHCFLVPLAWVCSCTTPCSLRQAIVWDSDLDAFFFFLKFLRLWKEALKIALCDETAFPAASVGSAVAQFGPVCYLKASCPWHPKLKQILCHNTKAVMRMCKTCLGYNILSC